MGAPEAIEVKNATLHAVRLQDGDPHGVGKMVWPDGRTLRAQECHM